MHLSRLILLGLVWCGMAISGNDPAAAAIVINEIMYNSPGTDVEYVELHNTSATPVDLTDWYLLDDDDLHPPCLLVGSLGGGDYLVVAADSALFAGTYPNVSNLNPNYFDEGGLGFGLGNGGDQVRLFDTLHALADSVEYGDDLPWPPEADGAGPSLELLNPFLDNALATSWAASTDPVGTPGRENSVYVAETPPSITETSRDAAIPSSTTPVTISARVTDNSAVVQVLLHVDINGTGFFSAEPMFDDGLHGDGAASDSVYGAVIPAHPPQTLVRYYVSATDDFIQTSTDPDNAPVGYYGYTVDHLLPSLSIQEVLASNVTGILDEAGERDDWLEIHNHGAVQVDLGGMYLSDDLGVSMSWMLPGTILPPFARLIIWADDDVEQGPFHTDFQLSSAGEAAGLFESVDHGNVLIHGFTFGVQSADVSFGYYPEGADAPEYLATPTPGSSNDASTLLSTICINELLTTSANGGVDDWVELFNRGPVAVDVGGWHLTDDLGQPDRYTFPIPTLIEPGAWLAVNELTLGFGFASDGSEVVMLTAPDLGIGMDYYDFGPQLADVSEGRFPDGQAFWYPLAPPTPGAPNVDPVAVDPTDPVTILEPGTLRGFPNPFGPSTHLSFEMSTEEVVSVRIYSASGRKIRVLHEGPLAAGRHALVWDGRNDAGLRAPAGVYLARFRSGGRYGHTKLVLHR